MQEQVLSTSRQLGSDNSSARQVGKQSKSTILATSVLYSATSPTFCCIDRHKDKTHCARAYVDVFANTVAARLPSATRNLAFGQLQISATDVYLQEFGSQTNAISI